MKEEKILIEFVLIPLERALVFQVTWQDESLRGKLEYVARNGIKIISNINPLILSDSKKVCLRGVLEDKDYEVSTLQFDTNAEREEFMHRVLEAFTEWRASMNAPEPEKPAHDLSQYTHRY